MDTTPVLDWCGSLLSDHVTDAPEAVRGWLRLGFDLRHSQTELAPNRTYLPSGRMAAGVPPTYCSFHRALLGTASAGVLAAPRMAANCSVACDANNLTFKTLGRLWDVPHPYVDVPLEAGPAAVGYVASRLIARRLEAEGVPTLVTDGDGCGRANCMEGQTTTRFDAILEMLRDRRAHAKGKETPHA